MINIVILITLISGVIMEKDYNLPRGHLQTFSRDTSHVNCSIEMDQFSGKKRAQVFFEQADFGFISKVMSSMMPVCESESDSSLLCSENLLFCRGKNIFIDLTNVAKDNRNMKYKMDILKPGEIGGHCDIFHREDVMENMAYLSPLQSWAPEMRFFNNVSLENGEKDILSSSHCDLVINRPTFIVKLDATVNMYHHFCDFFNIFASLYIVEDQLGTDVAYNLDNNILIWENYPYRSNFGDVFKAFTSNDLLNLHSFGSKKVCFKNAIFPLLPRMLFGLYYNTPIISECENTKLFPAFSDFIKHRLGIYENSHTNSQVQRKLRVTLISRLAKHRNIVNEKQLVQALEDTERYEVIVAKFTHHTPFLQQMKIVHNTDILIGMHGAGLTHLLFLKTSSVVFELYNCQDPNCYLDLARIRGVKYITWTDENKIKGVEKEDKEHKGHPKFMDYQFDVDEFVIKVAEAEGFVRNHPEFDVTLTGKDKDEL